MGYCQIVPSFYEMYCLKIYFSDHSYFFSRFHANEIMQKLIKNLTINTAQLSMVAKLK
jgi:hypothetical protein